MAVAKASQTVSTAGTTLRVSRNRVMPTPNPKHERPAQAARLREHRGAHRAERIEVLGGLALDRPADRPGEGHHDDARRR